MGVGRKSGAYRHVKEVCHVFGRQRGYAELGEQPDNHEDVVGPPDRLHPIA